MARVLGIGGVFFKCQNRESLSAWYETCLGFDVNSRGGCAFHFSKVPEDSFCMWGPFSADTEYFSPSEKTYMINLIVDDVEAVLAKAHSGGATIVGEIDNHEYGRFGWLMDPEGNKIELWEPNAAAQLGN